MKKLILFVGILTLLLTPVLASADDLYPPSWRGGPRTIFAHWDTWVDTSPPALYPDSFQAFGADGNPSNISQPFIDLNLSGFGIYDASVPGKLSFNTTTIEFPTLVIKANNFDFDNPVKNIQLQLTYDWNRRLSEVSAAGDPQGTVITSFTNTLDPDNAKVFSLVNIKMQPNPYVEFIYLTFEGQCYLTMDQIVLDTQCVPTPIPGSLLLLGSGVLGLVGIGIRRKL